MKYFKSFALFLVLVLGGCDALSVAGSSRVSDNVAVSVGTTITDSGIQRPRGKLTVGLF